MALAESGRSTGEVSLASLMAGLQVVTDTSGLTYADIAAEAVRGGWPALINGSLNAASLFARSSATISTARTSQRRSACVTSRCDCGV